MSAANVDLPDPSLPTTAISGAIGGSSSSSGTQLNSLKNPIILSPPIAKRTTTSAA